MSVIDLMIQEVPAGVRNDGMRLADRGAVKIIEADHNSADAEVMDRGRQTVTLDWNARELQYGCTCGRHARAGELCPHVWGAIIQARRDKWLAGLEDRGTIWTEWIPSEDTTDDLLNQAVAGRTPLAALNELLAGLRSQQSGQRGSLKPKKTSPPPPPEWQKALHAVATARNATLAPPAPWPHDRQIVYTIDAAATLQGRGLVVEVATREPKRNGELAKPKALRLTRSECATLPEAADREVLGAMLGAISDQGYYGYQYAEDGLSSRCRLRPPLDQTLVRLMCQTGRCRLRRTEQDPEPATLAWDEGGPWEFWLDGLRDDKSPRYILRGSLRRTGERRDLSEPVVLTAGGLVFFSDRAAPLRDWGCFGWIGMLRDRKQIAIPLGDGPAFIRHFLTLPAWPRLDLPDELRFEETVGVPLPKLVLKKTQGHYHGDDRLSGSLLFVYGATEFRWDGPERGVFDAASRRLQARNAEEEAQAVATLLRLGVRRGYYDYGGNAGSFELPSKKLPLVTRQLLTAGWHVEAEGKLYRRPGAFQIEVTSGIDWFDLNARLNYDGQSVPLPRLLEALRRGDGLVPLGDGTFGMLPEDWLKKYGVLAGTGTAVNGTLRFSRAQAGLLDALLATQEQVQFDAEFQRVRQRLASFSGVQAADAPPTFVGELRPYQRDGLGWFGFLREFGFGGCLADDMGLGKTIQVLALLDARRGACELRAEASQASTPLAQPASLDPAALSPSAAGASSSAVALAPPPLVASPDSATSPGSHRPSLVVAPRSLIFNWMSEAARFAPQLRVLDQSAPGRTRGIEHLGDYDLVLTTYGTLRRDAGYFKDANFDYLILDEAQAVKNAATESAKAVRLLRGRHRLALSGTPIENHLGELWSLFEFLNPGMLGAASAFQSGLAAGRTPDGQTGNLLAKALRPFILRRTKEQVARDLPACTEQTLFCDLDDKQRALYDELREYYRKSLMTAVETQGLGRAKIMVLEALLRLRQAACHPALLQGDRSEAPSAKLDMLLPKLAEVIEEGHKALVFSQFTSLLAIVKRKLDERKVKYAYLDGKTRDRAERVREFQDDPNCRLFLVSLKAGGLGLNLTAADYVFLLDPWWNPAVEAQAIDRAHRIGQDRHVFAYRLIARGTVEEKVMQLQETKRALADAIINQDNSLIGSLTREDLQVLLS